MWTIIKFDKDKVTKIAAALKKATLNDICEKVQILFDTNYLNEDSYNIKDKITNPYFVNATNQTTKWQNTAK